MGVKLPVKNLPGEKWAPAPGVHAPYYSVSTHGRVFSWGACRVMSPGVTQSNYKFVIFWYGGEKTYWRVSRLVMATFIGRSDLQVNHKDGNKRNNHLRNLEYCTSSENQRHALDAGLRKKGEQMGNAKLTEECVRDIRRRFKAGEKQRDIAKIYGVSQNRVWALCTDDPKHRSWKHVV